MTNGLCPHGRGFAAVLVLVCYFFTPPAGAHPRNSNSPININYIYGFNDQRPQAWINQNLYVILWLGALWLGAYLPTHRALRKIFILPARAKHSSSVTPAGNRPPGLSRV